MPNLSNVTRLRFVSSKKPETLIEFLEGLGVRVQIYQIVHASGKWYLWFVPGELTKTADIKRVGDLD